jgi:putative transposase
LALALVFPMTRKSYPSDLTDDQWQHIEPLIPPAKPGGRPRAVDMRQILDAMLYLNRTGCQWRALPHDFPAWGTVADYFYRFRQDGTWRTIHDRLREQVRLAAGKQATPSAAVIDSQSVKTTEKGGFAGTTRARKSRAANAISSWTPSG